MYIRFFFCAAALLPLAYSVAAQDALATQTGFFHRMAAAAKAGVNDVVNPGANASSNGPMYTAVSKSTPSFEGLFNHSVSGGYSTHLGWPRAAISFDTYGKDLPCWTGHVRVWTSEKASSVERFKVCAADTLQTADATGRMVGHSSTTVETYSNHFETYTDTEVANTGSRRTDGPLPPAKTFAVALENHDTSREATAYAIAGKNRVPHTLDSQYRQMLPRLALASGFLTAEDFASRPLGPPDLRMWVVGFDPAGNQDR